MDKHIRARAKSKARGDSAATSAANSAYVALLGRLKAGALPRGEYPRSAREIICTEKLKAERAARPAPRGFMQMSLNEMLNKMADGGLDDARAVLKRYC